MIEVYPSGRFWITINDETFTLTDGQVVTVPAGFPFDGHTIPPPFSFFINPYSADMRAALLHDYLFELKERGEPLGDRAHADREYLHQLRLHRTNWLRRTTLYVGVRLFSWIFWYLPRVTLK